MPRRRKHRLFVPRIRAGSASRVFEFETCARKLAYNLDPEIPKVEPAPDSPLGLGKRVHTEGEDFLAGRRKDVPSFYRYFAKELRALKKAGAVPEAQWAFTRKWETCDWRSRSAWCRMVVDAHVARKTSLRIVDFKTGYAYPDKDEAQLDLYALGAFHRFPWIRSVRAELWYLKLDQDVAIDYTRTDEPRLREAWTPRIEALIQATAFPASPRWPWPCKYCDFHRDKGGPCKEAARG